MTQKRTHILHVRLTQAGMAAVDRMRGTLTRSEYIRQLLRRDAERRAK